MSQLHVIVHIETESSTLPDFVVTASTWSSGIHSMILNFTKGSYTACNVMNPDNYLDNKICVNVESTQHTPPYVAINMATFDAAKADECIRASRHRNFPDKRKYLLDINSAAFLDADKQGCAWYVRVCLDALQATDDMVSVNFKGRNLPGHELSG